MSADGPEAGPSREALAELEDFGLVVCLDCDDVGEMSGEPFLCGGCGGMSYRPAIPEDFGWDDEEKEWDDDDLLADPLDVSTIPGLRLPDVSESEWD